MSTTIAHNVYELDFISKCDSDSVHQLGGICAVHTLLFVDAVQCFIRIVDTIVVVGISPTAYFSQSGIKICYLAEEFLKLRQCLIGCV